MTNVNLKEGYATSENPEYYPCDKFPPPQGRKLILLTIGGVAIIGQYNNADKDFIAAWSPMPKISKEVRTYLRSLEDSIATRGT